MRQPGYLAEPLGARVEQFYALENAIPVDGSLGTGEASMWAEQLKTTSADAEVLLKYGPSNGWLDGQPCVVSRHFGKGRITYIGAVLDDQLVAAAADWMVKNSDIEPAFGPVPDGVEVSRRTGEGKTVFVLINFKHERKESRFRTRCGRFWISGTFCNLNFRSMAWPSWRTGRSNDFLWLTRRQEPRFISNFNGSQSS